MEKNLTLKFTEYFAKTPEEIILLCKDNIWTIFIFLVLSTIFAYIGYEKEWEIIKVIFTIISAVLFITFLVIFLYPYLKTLF